MNASTAVNFSGPEDTENPLNKLCVWKIVGLAGKIIKLVFTSLHGYVVKVYDSGTADDNYYAGAFSLYSTNYKPGDPVYSTGHYMFVVFESSYSVSGSFGARVTTDEAGTFRFKSTNVFPAGF